MLYIVVYFFLPVHGLLVTDGMSCLRGVCVFCCFSNRFRSRRIRASLRMLRVAATAQKTYTMLLSTMTTTATTQATTRRATSRARRGGHTIRLFLPNPLSYKSFNKRRRRFLLHQNLKQVRKPYPHPPQPPPHARHRHPRRPRRPLQHRLLYRRRQQRELCRDHFPLRPTFRQQKRSG